MKTVDKLIIFIISGFLFISVTGCSPEAGSEAWCTDLKEKSKGDWTANEAAEFTKSCIFK